MNVGGVVPPLGTPPATAVAVSARNTKDAANAATSTSAWISID